MARLLPAQPYPPQIRVYCRVRPLQIGEVLEGAVRPHLDRRSLTASVGGQEHAFTFNHVFGPSVNQQQVFGEISELVQSSLDGFNVCIFAYGQTGEFTRGGGLSPVRGGFKYLRGPSLAWPHAHHMVVWHALRVWQDAYHDGGELRGRARNDPQGPGEGKWCATNRCTCARCLSVRLRERDMAFSALDGCVDVTPRLS